MSEDADAFAPATLQLLENGWFSIYFACDEFDDTLEVEAAFEAYELDAGGYGWEAVLAPALQARDSDAYDAIEWSPEADTFVAISQHQGPLRVLAQVLREVVTDQMTLERAISRHDPNR